MGSRKVKPTVESFTQRHGMSLAQRGEVSCCVSDKTDEEAQQSAGDYGGDHFIAFSTWRWLESQVETGSSVYRYFFELGSPGDAHHAEVLGLPFGDIEYVFGTLDSRVGAIWRAEDRKLSDEIDLLDDFARSVRSQRAI